MNGDTRAGAPGWHDDEVVLAGLPDKRLARRFGRLLDQMSAAPGQPVPAACGDWAAAKAAYRFFNPRVTEHEMLAGHFAATDAFEPSCNSRRDAARVDGSELLDTHEVQGDLD